MEIHKPKAAHSIREFLIEIGTIICGILIALGLEQIVEAVHRNSEVREAREALHQEILANLRVIVTGAQEDKCLLTQLPAFAAWARGGPKPPPYRSILRQYRTSTFDTVKTSAVPHMALKERLAVTALYDEFANAQKVIDIQRARAQVLLGVYGHDVLDKPEADRLIDAVEVDRALTHIHLGLSAGLLSHAHELGVEPAPLSREDVQEEKYLCGGVAPDAHTPEAD